MICGKQAQGLDGALQRELDYLGSGFSHQAVGRDILAQSGSQALVNFCGTPAVITLCDVMLTLLAAEKLRAEGGAAIQFAPSKADGCHFPLTTVLGVMWLA